MPRFFLKKAIILYEKLKKGIGAFDCQTLLAPITCKLGDEQCAAVLENPEEMEKFGFIVEDFGRGNVLVRYLPFLFIKSLIGVKLK